jgi:hypothetical protein
MARNAGHQNLDRKLKVEWDTEGITGMVETAWEKTAVGTETVWEMETAWEKAAVGIKMEMGTEKKTAQTEKTTAKMEKRMVEMEKTVEGTWKTAVNKKTEWESLYQNRCTTRQTDGRTILYDL